MINRSFQSSISPAMGWGITPAVKWLMIANIAAFVLSMILVRVDGAAEIVRGLMLTPNRVTRSLALWQLVTYLFLHGGFFHIFFNMWALWMIGGELERTWGSRRFLHYYLLTGIGAGLCVVLVNPNSVVATLGASGAIYGILLAYGMLFPNRMILMYFFLPIPAKYLVMILGGIALLSELTRPGDVISNVAHLGGLIVGFLYLRGRPLYFDLRNRYYRWRRVRLQQKFEVYQRRRDREEGRPPRPDDWRN